MFPPKISIFRKLRRIWCSLWRACKMANLWEDDTTQITFWNLQLVLWFNNHLALSSIHWLSRCFSWWPKWTCVSIIQSADKSFDRSQCSSCPYWVVFPPIINIQGNLLLLLDTPPKTVGGWSCELEQKCSEQPLLLLDSSQRLTMTKWIGGNC